MNVRPEQLRLYAVTDRAWSPDTEDFFRRIGAAIDGGATFVQLREKHMSRENFLDEARRFVALCRSRGVVSIINDNVEIAIEVGADGVHVGQAVAAQAAGADYLGAGAAFVTSTKGDARPIPHAMYRAITDAVDIPVVAIGGITEENMAELRGCGLDGVAVVSSLFAAQDVAAAAGRLRALAETL